MITVNLEKELIKANKKIHTPYELLLIKEYERIAQTETDHSVLERVGIIGSVVNGKEVKQRADNKKKSTEKFNQERVFHISQIEDICKKYHLRFLQSHYFSGYVDESLADNITTFEVAYGERLNATNSFIVAPASSFKLEKKPKDPLFFYCINDEYYYLIHKWGNDLSFIRRFYGFLSKGYSVSLFCWLVSALIVFFTALFVPKGIWQALALLFAAIIAFAIPLFNALSDGEDEIRFVKKNEWRSKYL